MAMEERISSLSYNRSRSKSSGGRKSRSWDTKGATPASAQTIVITDTPPTSALDTSRETILDEGISYAKVFTDTAVAFKPPPTPSQNKRAKQFHPPQALGAQDVTTEPVFATPRP